MLPRMALLTVCVIVGICHLLLAVLLPWNRSRTTQLDDAPPVDGKTGRLPTVLVIVPARNEEPNIEACVRSVLAQDYPALTMRVIDDHSTDQTAAIVRRLAATDARLSLLHAPDLPPGWFGKPHALHAATREVDADYLLFIDADVRLEKTAVSKSVAVAEKEQSALLTLVPTLVAESFWERAIQPVVGMILFALLDPTKVRSPESSVATVYGPYLMFRRTAYQSIGGHAAVATEVVDDLRMAQIIKGAGLRLSYVHGTDVLYLRMYDSLRAIVNGWKKNFHVALGSALWLAPIGALLLALVFAGPLLFLVGSLVAYAVSGAAWTGSLLGASVLCYGADLVARVSLSRYYGITLRGSRSIGGLAVAYILLASSYQAALGKPVTWRGRAYPSSS